MKASLDIKFAESARRNALSDFSEIQSCINPHMMKAKPRVRIWQDKAGFRIETYEDQNFLPQHHKLELKDLLGESHHDYMKRYNRKCDDHGEVKTVLRLMEGSDPLRSIRMPYTSFRLHNSIRLCGVDSALATVDQFDDILSIVSADAHLLKGSRDNFASRTDLFVLNPKVVRKDHEDKIMTIERRAEIPEHIGKAMRELEYALAYTHGRNNVVIMDGTISGQDKVFTNAMVAKGVMFVSVVKNPVSRMVADWYPDLFSEHGYEYVGIDAVAFNDILPPGTRSPLIFHEMVSKPISWSSKVFAYLKPDIPGTTVLRVEVPSDYAYMAEKIVEIVHSACLANGDALNCTALPVVNAEYAARAMLPDPFDIAEDLKATLAAESMVTRMQGSYNSRRSMSEWRPPR